MVVRLLVLARDDRKRYNASAYIWVDLSALGSHDPCLTRLGIIEVVQPYSTSSPMMHGSLQPADVAELPSRFLERDLATL
jgi:hypothetical protein